MPLPSAVGKTAVPWGWGTKSSRGDAAEAFPELVTVAAEGVEGRQGGDVAAVCDRRGECGAMGWLRGEVRRSQTRRYKGRAWEIDD
jgi:hypothetical protein